MRPGKNARVAKKMEEASKAADIAKMLAERWEIELRDRRYRRNRRAKAPSSRYLATFDHAKERRSRYHR